MSTYEIVFYAIMGAGILAVTVWMLARGVGRDPGPVKGYRIMSFSLWVLCAAIFLRLFDSWSTLSEALRFFTALALALFSTSAALLLVQSRRLSRRA